MRESGPPRETAESGSSLKGARLGIKSRDLPQENDEFSKEKIEERRGYHQARLGDPWIEAMGDEKRPAEESRGETGEGNEEKEKEFPGS